MGFWKEALKHSAPLAILSVLLYGIIKLKGGTVVFALDDLVCWLVLACILGIVYSLYFYFRERSYQARTAEINDAVKTRTDELKTRNTNQQTEITKLQKELRKQAASPPFQSIKPVVSIEVDNDDDSGDFTKPE